MASEWDRANELEGQTRDLYKKMRETFEDPNSTTRERDQAHRDFEATQREWVDEVQRVLRKAPT